MLWPPDCVHPPRICFGVCTTEIKIPVLLNVLWYVYKRHCLSQLSLPVNRSFHLEQLLLTSWSLPWQVIPTLLSFILPLLMSITLTQNISCASDTAHLMWGLMQEAKWGLVHPNASPSVLPGPPESSHKSYCSYSAEDYTNQHLFLAYFIGHCFIVPYKLVTTYPLGCTGRGLFLWSGVGLVPSEEGPGSGQGVGSTLASFKVLLKFCLLHFSLFGPKPVAIFDHSAALSYISKSI